MVYTLTLTQSERQAIDWVGERYRHGTDLYKLLWLECKLCPNDAGWDDEGEITFNVPEWVAWGIREIIEEDNLACFSDGLRNKLYEFSDKIV